MSEFLYNKPLNCSCGTKPILNGDICVYCPSCNAEENNHDAGIVDPQIVVNAWNNKMRGLGVKEEYKVNPIPEVADVMGKPWFSELCAEFPLFNNEMVVDECLQSFEQLFEGIPTDLHIQKVVNQVYALETDYEDMEDYGPDAERAVQSAIVYILKEYGDSYGVIS